MLGVIYCDLKLENILVCDDGYIMVIDFDFFLRCIVSFMFLNLLFFFYGDVMMRFFLGSCIGFSCIELFCF